MDKSSIDGIGLFADQDIAEGTVIWRFCDEVDIRLSPDALNSLPAPTRAQIEKYSYREKHSGLYVLCGDDARFFNHSTDPNCIDIYEPAPDPRVAHDITIALRDIEWGEELTCDYSLFDLDFVEGRYYLPTRSGAVVPAGL
ncbi:MAG: SET domain-containing protein [Pyrinomonadaceae bacterium]